MKRIEPNDIEQRVCRVLRFLQVFASLSFLLGEVIDCAPPFNIAAGAYGPPDASVALTSPSIYRPPFSTSFYSLSCELKPTKKIASTTLPAKLGRPRTFTYFSLRRISSFRRIERIFPYSCYSLYLPRSDRRLRLSKISVNGNFSGLRRIAMALRERTRC